MKKQIIAALALTCAASLFAQGTVDFNNRNVGLLVTKVYAPQAATPTVAVYGSTSSDTPSGTTVYTGLPLSGAGWVAQLWAANGANQVESSLAAATPSTVFRTGAAAGFVTATTATLTGVPKDAAAATLQLRVYPSTFATWAAAETAWAADKTGTIGIGKSLLFNVSGIGGDLNTPPILAGLTSFSLAVNIVPEPSTFALLGLGALGMMIFRRK
jgi:hypothetical protein